MKHHTLSHRNQNFQANSSKKDTIHANASQTEAEDKPQTAVVNSHCKMSPQRQ